MLLTINVAIEKTDIPLVEAHLAQIKILGSGLDALSSFMLQNEDSPDIHVLNTG